MSEGHTIPVAAPESPIADVVASALAIRGQCHAIVRCVNRPNELIERLRVVEDTLDRIVESAGGASTSIRVEHGEVLVDVGDLVRSVVRRFDGLARMTGVRLELPANREAAAVRCGPRLLDATLHRLVAQAVSTADGGAVVRLDLRRRNHTIVIQVSRRGLAMPPLTWRIIAGECASDGDPGTPGCDDAVRGACA